jgi:hypothetical protein
MDNIFSGVKFGQIQISMRERNASAIGRSKFLDELASPIPKPILPAPPRQYFDIKNIRRTLNPEESKRVQMEKRLKNYLELKPPKLSRDDLLQALMIKELLSKQLKRNKELKEQLRKGFISDEQYQNFRTKDNVLLAQSRTAFPLIEDELLAMGIDTDRMEAFFENPSPPSDQVETVASETGDLLDRIIDTQERNTIQTAQTAPLVPSGGGRSVAERVAEQEGRVVEYPKTPQEIVLLPDQILIDLARGTGRGRQTEGSRIAVDWIRQKATGMTAEEFLEREQRRGEERRERTGEVARRVSKKLRQKARKELKKGGK